MNFLIRNIRNIRNIVILFIASSSSLELSINTNTNRIIDKNNYERYFHGTNMIFCSVLTHEHLVSDCLIQ